MISNWNTVVDKQSPVTLNFLFLLSVAFGLAVFLENQTQIIDYVPYFFQIQNMISATFLEIYLILSAIYFVLSLRRVFLQLGLETVFLYFFRLFLLGNIFRAFIYPLALTQPGLAFFFGLGLFLLGFQCYSLDPEALRSVKNATVEILRELKRVQWPSHSETLRFVGIVALFVSLSSLFWWVIDGMITRVLSFLFNMLG